MRMRLLNPNTPELWFSNFFKRYRGRLLLFGASGEPKYDGVQVWFHEDIPNYDDPTKNVVNQKYPIINY